MSKLKLLRQRKGVSQKALANELGISRQTMARYERDPGKMSIDQARTVADFLSCRVESIFLDDDVSFTNSKNP